MPNICISTEVAQNYRTVFEQFDEDLFLKLAPPGASVNLLQFDGCHTGDVVEMELRLLGFIKQRWKSLISDFKDTPDEIYFIDESHGKDLPFFLKNWHHHHRIVKIDEHKTAIIDDINYETPFGLNYLMFPILYTQFAWRRPIYQKVFGKI